MKTYIIDSDVLIGLYDNLPMETYETQWNMLKKYIEEGRIIICDAVFNEIKKAEELKKWLNELKKFVVPCYTRDIIVEAKIIVNDYPKLIDINNPSDQSDPYVIAIAKMNNYTILSNESYGEGGKKTKIPYVCKKLSVDCLNTRKFYIEENWKF